MTAYFDTRDRELRKASTASEGYLDFPVIERMLVDDVTFAAESEGFPPDLRVAVHEAVLRWGVDSLPECAPADFEEDAEHYRRLCRLSSDLHTIFHDVGNREIVGITDDPRGWRQRVLNSGVAFREHLAEVRRWGPVRERAVQLGWVHDPARGTWTAAGVLVVWFDLENATGWHTPWCKAPHHFEAAALAEALATVTQSC